MRILPILLKIAGKENLNIDRQIRPFYMIRLCWKYAKMALHGRLLSIFYSGISKTAFIGKGVHLYEKHLLRLGAKSKIHDGVTIDCLSRNGVEIGTNVVIGCGTKIECTGSLQYVGKGIKIGNRTTFGNDCFFGSAGGIEIGEDVIAGQFIRFHSENHNYDSMDKLIREQGVRHMGIKVGNNCWIGSGAVFLDGAELGNGCVVAANTVVTKKFRDNSVIGGIPAKVIKMRDTQKETMIENRFSDTEL